MCRADFIRDVVVDALAAVGIIDRTPNAPTSGTPLCPAMAKKAQTRKDVLVRFGRRLVSLGIMFAIVLFNFV
jgi:hypothetical protein